MFHTSDCTRHGLVLVPKLLVNMNGIFAALAALDRLHARHPNTISRNKIPQPFDANIFRHEQAESHQWLLALHTDAPRLQDFDFGCPPKDDDEGREREEGSTRTGFRRRQQNLDIFANSKDRISTKYRQNWMNIQYKLRLEKSLLLKLCSTYASLFIAAVPSTVGNGPKKNAVVGLGSEGIREGVGDKSEVAPDKLESLFGRHPCALRHSFW